VKIVVPSRKRADTIAEHTLSVFPDAYVLVAEEEEKDYAKVSKIRQGHLLTHPNLPNLAAIYNHILDEILPLDDAVAICGDDTLQFHALIGWAPRRIRDPQQAMSVVRNAAQCAKDAGAKLFGFGANPNPICYEPCRPIKLSRWIGSPFGMLHGIDIRFDERLALMQDVDFCLQSLLKHRIIWCDSRFATTGIALNNAGGNAHLRSEAAYEKERRLLKQKWGPYIRFDTVANHSSKRYKEGKPSTTLQTYVHVPRTQSGF
jgi:hypothetical protein